MTLSSQSPDAAVISGLGCCAVTGDQPATLYQRVLAGANVGSFVQAVPWPADLPHRSVPQDGRSDSDESLMLAQVPGPVAEHIAGLRRPFPDRPTLMAILAADGALAHSALLRREVQGAPEPWVDLTRVGVVVGTCFGPSQTVERYLRTLLTDGPAQVSPIAFSRAVASSLVGELCRRHQLKGPSTVILGASVVGYALDLLWQGAADAVLCVGVDEVRDLHGWAYQHAGLLANGLVLGEGAAALVLERESLLQRRKGHALAQIIDYTAGFCASSVQQLPQVSQVALEASMSGLLRMTHQSAESVGLVVGMASSDAGMIQTERMAVRSCLSPSTEILWPKHTLGETFGASEILGVLVGTLALGAQSEEKAPERCVMVNTAQVGGMVGSILLRPAPVGSPEVTHGT